MDLAERFERFGARECAEESLLYARLSHAVAGDPDLLAIAAKAAPGQAPPNLLFAAAHYLLLKGEEDPLSFFYASLGGADDARAVPAFRDFCLRHRTEIEDLVATRRVQTNEVRRCAPLIMALSRIPARKLALIDVGASAGLNLAFDRYGYDLGGEPLGDLGAPVQIAVPIRGSAPRVDAMPDAVLRTGIDLAPVDVGDLDAVLWLRALVWPEDRARASTLERAIWMARQDPPALLAGDAASLLPTILANVPDDVTPVVFHSAAAHQMAPETRERLASFRVWRVSLEWLETDVPKLELFAPDGSGRLLARVDGHVRWIEWLES